MLLEFDKNKEKNVQMVVEASGIDENTLDITFNIIVNDVKYGFPCKIQENKVIIKVPALDTVIKDLKPGKYRSTLDITSSGKYFLQPFNEEIEVIEVPDVKIDKGTLQEDKLSVVISELIEDDEPVKVDEKIIDKPKDFGKEETVEEGVNNDTNKPKTRVMDKIVNDEKKEELKSLLSGIFE